MTKRNQKVSVEVERTTYTPGENSIWSSLQ